VVLGGQYCAESVEAVEQLLSGFLSRIDIRRGWIPETFRGLENNRYAFAHLDVDLYQSTFDCCKYFYPRLVSGGIFVV
jgi:O-methyltransferase